MSRRGSAARGTPEGGGPPRPRRAATDARGTLGASVPELVVALLVGLLVVQLALETLAGVRSAHGRMSARTDALVALRVGRFLLRSELRFGHAGRDWRASPDSLPLRAFRGAALVCPSRPAPDELWVRYQGIREPDPAKDSVLLIRADGTGEVRALMNVGAGSGTCEAAGVAAAGRWRLDAEPSGEVVVARLFERGVYHLTNRALRYERGGSGRQPLTPEVWTPATLWSPVGERLEVRLVPRDSRAGEAWTGFLAWRAPS